MGNNSQYAKLLRLLESGESIVDIGIEMGNRGINSMKIPKTNIHIMGIKGKGNAIDPLSMEKYRVFSMAYERYKHPIHYIFLGTKEKGWQVTTDDSQFEHIFEAFLVELEGVGENPVFSKSLEATGIKRNNITWSGRKAITIEGADFSAM